MKKILLTCLILSLPCLPAFSQSFVKGSLVAEAGAGLGIYRITATDKSKNETNSDTTAAWVFPLTMEYGLSNYFGIGGTFKYSNYIEGDSSSTLGVNGFDLAVQPAFHFLNRRRIDMSLYGQLGATYISFRANDYDNVRANGFGPVYGIGLTMRIYFSDVIGMYLGYSYTSFAYNDIVVKDNSGNQFHFKLAEKGSNFGLGLVFKIK